MRPTLGAALLAVSALVPTLAHAQSAQQAVGIARSSFPGDSRYEHLSQRDRIVGLRRYVRHTIRGYRPADLQCFPNAQASSEMWVELWSDGSLKHKAHSGVTYYHGTPHPKIPAVEAALEAAGVQAARLYSPSYLWDVLEIQDLSVVESDDLEWRSDTEVWVKGTITSRVLRGCCKVATVRHDVVFELTSDDCGRTFTFQDGRTTSRSENYAELDVQEVTAEEGKALARTSIGRKLAEQQAQEEWEALVELDLPAFETPVDVARTAHRIFATGTREEAKSLLYRLTPSWQFLDGSKYILQVGQDRDIRDLLDALYDPERGYAQEYCVEPDFAEVSGKRIKIANKLRNTNTTYVLDKDGDRWVIREVKAFFSDPTGDPSTDATLADCDTGIATEPFEATDAAFAMDLPPGVQRQKSAPTRYPFFPYKATSGPVSYTVHVTHFDATPRDDEARLSLAKQNAESYLKYQVDVFEREDTRWEYEGIPGWQLRLRAKPRRGGAEFQEVRRMILVDNAFYDIAVRAPVLTAAHEAVLDTFRSLKDPSANRPAPRGPLAVGDGVLVEVSRLGAKRGVVREIRDDGVHVVLVPGLGTYQAPEAALAPDPDGAVEIPTFEVGDFVVVTHDWNGDGFPESRKARIEEAMKDGFFMVLYYERRTKQGMPSSNLRPDPNPTMR
jgi:hypothetical protein